jgi:hypothetical protein
MPGLRDQLAKKRAHRTSLTFPLGEDGERAKAALEESQQRLVLAQVRAKDDAAIRAADQAVRRARTKYTKVSLTIEFRGLTEEERDTLMAAHPATDEMRVEDADKDEDEKRDINRKTFLPAALEVCALESDLTEEEWADELSSDRWTAGEANALFKAVVSATHEEPTAGIPKD